MTDTIKKLEVSAEELNLFISALETQSKILQMQASAGGKGANERLNDVKSLLANISSQVDVAREPRAPQSGVWNMLRSLREAI